MKKKKSFSLWRILREELDSERRDLIFLLMILVPIAVGALVAYIHLFYLGREIEEVMKMVQNRGTVSVVVKQQSDLGAETPHKR